MLLTASMFEKFVTSQVFYLLRGLDGRDHFKTLLDFFKRRALYENIGKYYNLNEKICEFFFIK